MKKIRNFIAIAILASGFTFSCKPKEDKIISPITENEVPNGAIKTNFLLSVHVIASSEAGRTEGLEGATVTVSQNAKVLSKTVNKDGEAVFEDLIQGDYTLYVSKAGFASINKVGTLVVPNDLIQTVANDNDHTFKISSADLVELPSLEGGVMGNVLYDADLVPSTPLVAAEGLIVRLEYESTIQPNVFSTTIAADGVFSFLNVPNAPAKLTIEGTKTISGKSVKFSVSPSTVTPRIKGATNVGKLIANTDQASLLDKSGSFKFWPRGNFKFKSAAGSTNINIEDVLPDTVPVVLDFSSSITNPEEQKIYEGTRDAQGVWSFKNIPTDKEFEVKFALKVNILVDPSNLVLVASTDSYINNSPSAVSGIKGFNPNPSTIKYNKTITFNGIQNSSNNFTVTKNQAKDLGLVIIVEK